MIEVEQGVEDFTLRYSPAAVNKDAAAIGAMVACAVAAIAIGFIFRPGFGTYAVQIGLGAGIALGFVALASGSSPSPVQVTTSRFSRNGSVRIEVVRQNEPPARTELAFTDIASVEVRSLASKGTRADALAIILKAGRQIVVARAFESRPWKDVLPGIAGDIRAWTGLPGPDLKPRRPVRDVGRERQPVLTPASRATEILMFVTFVPPAPPPADLRQMGRSRAGSLLRMMAATAMLTPVLLFAALFLVVQIAASGRILDILARLAAALPTDPVLGVALLGAALLGGPAMLLAACILMPRLYPMLLLTIGVAAEIYVALLTGLADGSLWVLGSGAGGLLLSAMQVRAGRA